MTTDARGNPGSRSAGDSLWRRAASFAAQAHQTQTRRDGVTPYFAHPARVAQSISAVFGCSDPETIAIAFLHDTIEDTTTDYEDLADRFGQTVADGVVSLSKDSSLPEQQRDEHAKQRLLAGGWRVKLVKLADVLDNGSDLLQNGAVDPAEQARAGRLAARARWAVDAARASQDQSELLTAAAALVEESLADLIG